MNKARFQVLGFTVPSGSYKYHDDGYVDSILDTIMKVDKLYGLDNSNYNADEYIYAIGKYYEEGFNLHIFYLERSTKKSDIQNRSHEETHVLDYLGQLDALTDRLFEEQGVKINLKEVDDKEVIAQLGSLYALNARGLMPWLERGYKNNTFLKAERIYKQSKQPEKRFFIP
ncbi:hypothetical protein KAI32_00885 [Candidatus Pacearchaeota archaeon]|nr:hypothetical protein [Candidatus Pacearchaeota archaeon]